MFELSALASGLVFGVVLAVVPVTLLVTLVLVWGYRTRVRRSMRATSGGALTREQAPPPPPDGAPGRLEIEVLTATGELGRAARRQPPLVRLRRRARAVALTYVGAASILPLVLAAVLSLTIGFSPTRDVVALSALLFIGFFLVNATPVVLAPALVLSKQVAVQILAVLALMVAMWLFDRVMGTSLLQLWLLTSGVATGAFLLMSIRRLRAAGPIVFAASLLFFLCALGGVFYAMTLGWNALDIRFVRDDLAQLSPEDGFQRYVEEIVRMPGPDQAAALGALVAQPTSVIAPRHPDALTGRLQMEMVAWAAGAVVTGAAASVLFVSGLARHYRTRRASDQMLSVDVLMGVFTLYSLVAMAAGFGWGVGAYAIPAFGIYAVAARSGLRRLQRSAPSAPPRTLLFLRVFGFDRRTQRLLQDLGQQWRYLGPIRLIGGADLANSTIEPHEFFEFLNGRLTRSFVKDREDVERRLMNDAGVPDPDGLFRIEDWYCYENTWRTVVASVAPAADAVLMDLRGFGAANEGCVFEIGQLLASVPVGRIVLLIDRTTDRTFLERTLQDSWQTMPAGSPNRRRGTHRLRLLMASRRRGRLLDVLMGLLCESAEAPPAAPTPHPA
jgi:hypothetical protein